MKNQDSNRKDAALICGVITRAKVWDVKVGSVEYAPNGDERFETTDGKFLVLKDRAVLGYVLEEPRIGEADGNK
jgi:hypothetical protein